MVNNQPKGKAHIMNWLIKKLIPSAKTLSGYAADGIQKSVNGIASDKKAVVSKYSALATQATEFAAKLTRMLEDGTIDNFERDELAKIVEPLFDKAIALI